MKWIKEVHYMHFNVITKKPVINPFQSSVSFHLETSHLIRSANQVTGFYVQVVN